MGTSNVNQDKHLNFDATVELFAEFVNDLNKGNLGKLNSKTLYGHVGKRQNVEKSKNQLKKS